MNREMKEDESKKLTGLSAAEVEESRRVHGENILTPPEKTPLWKLFLEKFEDPIIRILLIAALLSLLMALRTGEIVETIGILFAIALATGIGFWFEVDAGKKFDILNKVSDEAPIKVLRDGVVTEVLKREIVVGDIVLLDTGDEVPADGELLESVSLTINESTLTGELQTRKTTNPQFFVKDATYPSNHVLRGTTVMEGHCMYVVEAVGDTTEYGKVAKKSSERSSEPTPLNVQLDKLAKFIGFAGFGMAILTFVILFLKDILSGDVQYSAANLWILCTLFVGGSIALMPVWKPIMRGGLEILGRKRRKSESADRGWVFWLSVGFLTILLLLVSGYLIGYNPIDESSWVDSNSVSRILRYFMVAVTLIVVAVPEGLPMAVTLSLALSMRKMLKTNNLVRKMHATETMGAATVICTDKTGTLTQNQMRVAEADFGGAEGSDMVVEGIAVNTTAFLDLSDPAKAKAIGNPTEGALLIWLKERGHDYAELRESAKVEEQLSFSTERKYMATIVLASEKRGRTLFVKGAPEIVTGFCKDTPPEIEGELVRFQAQAMRTLGFASRELGENESYESVEELVKRGDLNFLGVVAISDPVREDVPEAVAMCLQAGIDVKMVTGDTPGTAKEIGKRIGIYREGTSDMIITGPEFAALSDSLVMELHKRIKIMCRARPTDKERFVKLLQKAGEVVTVTGDGTNDAPALNHANVGLSMGSGTAVAKEASDITLLDDSFNSIVTAVLWGRSLYKNIQRFILFQLTINVAALLIVLLGSIIGEELPLTVTQMLWVNLIMDTFAAASLASLPPEKRVMEEKPRRYTDFIVNPAMRNNILAVGAIFVVAMLLILNFLTDSATDTISAYNLSVFFTIFVMLQFWNLFNAKAFASGGSAFKAISASPGFIAVAALIIVGQIVIVEFGGEFFRTVPISFKDWMIIAGGTSLVLWIGEILRLVGKRK